MTIRPRYSLAALALVTTASVGMLATATAPANAATPETRTSAGHAAVRGPASQSQSARQLGTCMWIGKPYGQKIGGKWHVVGQGGATCSNGLGAGRGFIEIELQQKRAWGWDGRQTKTLWGAGTAHPRAKCKSFGWYTWRTVASVYGWNGRNYSRVGLKTSSTWRTRC
ncbi:hypothetical protein ACOZ38_16820 [Sphaerisporangium viridialbum]|uniref:hypothetical protein n=1 Tax=Sphaerisporangium viridialbum TaxID=46189 RepID=UPI003C74F62B